MHGRGGNVADETAPAGPAELVAKGPLVQNDSVGPSLNGRIDHRIHSLETRLGIPRDPVVHRNPHTPSPGEDTLQSVVEGIRHASSPVPHHLKGGASPHLQGNPLPKGADHMSRSTIRGAWSETVRPPSRSTSPDLNRGLAAAFAST